MTQSHVIVTEKDLLLRKENTNNSTEDTSTTKQHIPSTRAISDTDGRTKDDQEQYEKEKKHENKQFADLLKKSARTLYSTTNVFPFAFFTDKIVVDENKFSVVYKNFFFSEQVKSILINDIARITAETDLFFGTLKVTDRNFTQSPIVIKFLKKSDALSIRRLVEGLLVTKKEGIEISKLHDESLKENLETIGKATE